VATEWQCYFSRHSTADFIKKLSLLHKVTMLSTAYAYA